MFFLRRVVGNSMSPALRPEQIALFKRSRRYREGQIVVARSRGREIVKRLAWQNGRQAYLQGDSPFSNDCFVGLGDLQGALVASF